MKKQFIAYEYKQHKITDKEIGFIKYYYCGYCDLKLFGIATINECNIEKAKRFATKKELESELKKIGRKVSDYKICEVCE